MKNPHWDSNPSFSYTELLSFFSVRPRKWGEKNCFFQNRCLEMTWILGKIWVSSDFLEYSRHCRIPYMGISGCRPRVTKSRPFLIPCSMSYFRLWNSSFGRCKIIQFGHNLGRDLHIVFAFVTKYWRWVHFPFALYVGCVVEFHSSEVPKALSLN